MTPASGKPPQEGELILYRAANDAVRVEVLYEGDTFWLDQKRIAELFGVELPTISYHLKEIYASGELTREATLRKLLRVQREGTREVRRGAQLTFLQIRSRPKGASHRSRGQRPRGTRREVPGPFKGKPDRDRLVWEPARCPALTGREDTGPAVRGRCPRLRWSRPSAGEPLARGWLVASAEVARNLAEEQYQRFRIQQDRAFESDFEKEVKRIEAQRPARQRRPKP